MSVSIVNKIKENLTLCVLPDGSFQFISRFEKKEFICRFDGVRIIIEDFQDYTDGDWNYILSESSKDSIAEEIQYLIEEEEMRDRESEDDYRCMQSTYEDLSSARYYL